MIFSNFGIENPFEYIQKKIENGIYDTQEGMFRFKLDVFEAYGLTEEANEVWDKAWEDGHFEGVEGVLYQLDNLLPVAL